MARTCRLLLSLCLALGWAGATTAEVRDIEAVLAEIQGNVANVETISCTFTQEKHLRMFETTMVSTGRFFFGKPDRLRWEYLTPVTEGFAVDNDQGVRWTGTHDARHKFSLRSDPIMNVVARQLLAWATFNRSWLDQEYAISLEQLSPVILRLTPKRPDVSSVLTSLLIEFSPARDTVRRIDMYEPGDDFTRIVFENATVNTALDDSLFR